MLVVTDTQQRWVQSRNARRAFSAEFPWEQGLPARHVATEPMVFNDPNFFFKIDAGTSVHAITLVPLIAGETSLRRAMASHIWGDSRVERGAIEMPLFDSDKIAGWQLDKWPGRRAILRWGDPRWERVFGSTSLGIEEAHVTVVEAIVRRVRYEQGRVIIEMHPDIALFDVIVNARFKADEAQGVIPAAPEVAGELVPLMLGQVFHAPAKLIESATLKFWRAALVSSSDDLEVRDNNVVLTEDTDFTSNFEILDLDNAIGKITWSGRQHDFFGGSVPSHQINKTMSLAFEVGETGVLDALSKSQPAGVLFGGVTNASLEAAMGSDVIHVGTYTDEETPFINALQVLADAAGLAWFVGTEIVSGERRDQAIFRRVRPPNAEAAILLSQKRTDTAASTFQQPIQRARIDANGNLVNAPVDTLRHDYDPETLEWRGVWIEGSQLNALDNSHAPATQTINLADHYFGFSDTTEYILHVLGSGSAEVVDGNGVSRGVATQGDPAIFRIPSTDVTVTVTGSLQGFRLERARHVASILDTAISRDALGDLLDIAGADFPAILDECTVLVEWMPAPRHDMLDTSDADELLTSDAGPLTVLGVRTETIIRLTNAAGDAGEQAVIGELDGAARVQVTTGGAVQADLSGASVRGAQPVRTVVRLAANDVGLAVDGAMVGVDSAATLPAITRLIVEGGVTERWQRLITVYPGVLTDAQLAAVSDQAADPDAFHGLGAPVFEFGPNQIRGGVQIDRASEALKSVAVARRASWADTGGDVIDPSLPAADKQALSKRWAAKVYSADIEVDTAPDNAETIQLELTDEASQDLEGMRLARLFERPRDFYRFESLTGAMQVQPGDIVQVWHDESSRLGPQRDAAGQIVRDAAGLPVRGRAVLVKATDELFPSGAINLESWA